MMEENLVIVNEMFEVGYTLYYPHTSKSHSSLLHTCTLALPPTLVSSQPYHLHVSSHPSHMHLHTFHHTPTTYTCFITYTPHHLHVSHTPPTYTHVLSHPTHLHTCIITPHPPTHMYYHTPITYHYTLTTICIITPRPIQCAQLLHVAFKHNL